MMEWDFELRLERLMHNFTTAEAWWIALYFHHVDVGTLLLQKLSLSLSAPQILSWLLTFHQEGSTIKLYTVVKI